MYHRPMKLLLVSLLFMLPFSTLTSGCDPDSDYSEENTAPIAISEDLVPYVDGKEDTAVFSPNKLIDQSTFEDALFMSGTEIQDFLENSPYGFSSFLATYQWQGELASQVIERVSIENQINPLVLLTKIQVESSLIFRAQADPFLMEVALGCGCLDTGPSCYAAPLGFGRQVECAGELLRSYLTSIDESGFTVSGWGPGINKKTSEGQWVNPLNSGTAALYTYTPWVLSGSGGNWLFWNVYRKFSSHILKGRPNYQWVGSNCESSNSCNYEGGVCMGGTLNCASAFSECSVETGSHTWESVGVPGEEGWATPVTPTGMCTAPCDLYCDDSSTVYTSTTFCALLPVEIDEVPTEQGWCLARCSPDLFPANEGCEEGYTCSPSARANDPETIKDVCWPDSFVMDGISE